MKTLPLNARLPQDLAHALTRVCRKLGLKRKLVIESALREKIEDLIDVHTLNEAIAGATGFHDWPLVNPRTHVNRRR